MDTLSQFLASVDVAKVEAERFQPLAVVRSESFGGPDHRAMLTVHEAELGKFARAYRWAGSGGLSQASIDAAEARGLRRVQQREQHRLRERGGIPSIAQSLAAHREQTHAATTHTAA